MTARHRECAIQLYRSVPRTVLRIFSRSQSLARYYEINVVQSVVSIVFVSLKTARITTLSNDKSYLSSFRPISVKYPASFCRLFLVKTSLLFNNHFRKFLPELQYIFRKIILSVVHLNFLILKNVLLFDELHCTTEGRDDTSHLQFFFF